MKQRRQSGFSLLEAMMASVLLAAATAGVLLPIVAAADAQTDANRRVLATRFAADVIERYTARDITLENPVLPEHLGHSGPAYQFIKGSVTTVPVYVPEGEEDEEKRVELILLTVEVFDNDRPMATLKTLVDNQ